MPKLRECDRCQLYAHNPFLICAVHPEGPDAQECLDFAPVSGVGAEELWEPPGASYYGDELILHRQKRWSYDEQLELLDSHPLLTGCCPACGWQFPQAEPTLVHWDCQGCGWKDDSI